MQVRGRGDLDWDDCSRPQGEGNRSEMYFACGVSRSDWIWGIQGKAVARVMPKLAQGTSSQWAGVTY